MNKTESFLLFEFLQARYKDIDFIVKHLSEEEKKEVKPTIDMVMFTMSELLDTLRGWIEG